MSDDKVWRPEDVADVPEPAGAVEIDIDWGVVAEGSPPCRHFIGRSWAVRDRVTRRLVGRCVVSCSGWWRGDDGGVERDVVVAPRRAEWPLSVPQTRELARMLMAAADECERLNSSEQ